MIQELLDLKKKDDKDVIPWGETYSMPIENGQVCHVGWKDQAFVLMMSSIFSSDDKVVQLRKRLKETSFKAKTSRVPFNHIRAIDEFDHLIA